MLELGWTLLRVSALCVDVFASFDKFCYQAVFFTEDPNAPPKTKVSTCVARGECSKQRIPTDIDRRNPLPDINGRIPTCRCHADVHPITVVIETFVVNTSFISLEG